MTVQVNDPSDKVSRSYEAWCLIDDLKGGTEAMRKAGQRRMPKRSLEIMDDYDARLCSATLLPAYTETTARMTGRVFAEQLQTGKDVPAWIVEEVLPDIDRQGRNHQQFFREQFNAAMDYGIQFILVDSPPAQIVDQTTGEAKPVQTLAEQKTAGIRPYLIPIKADRVLGWKEDAGVLKQVRIKFTKEEDDGEFGTKEVEQVRVYYPGKYDVYEMVISEGTTTKTWKKVDSKTFEYDGIPIVPIYTGRTGFFTAKPPLMELAHLNVKHWNQQSDVDELLKTASVPILVAYGGDVNVGIAVGAKSAVNMPQDGKLEYTEHSGKAIQAGVEQIKALKEDMRDAGGKLLEKQQGINNTKTAAQVTEEAAADNSRLGGIVNDFEDSIAAILDVVASWRGDAKGGSMIAQPNLDPDMAPIDTLKFLQVMAAGEQLSFRTLFEEAQKRGALSEDRKWEDEQQRIKDQIAAMPPPVLPPVQNKRVPTNVPPTE